MFGHRQYDISENITFHFLNIDNYSDLLKAKIEDEIAKIWNGDIDAADSDINVIKKELQELIINKDDRQKHGIVAEFICHLFLRELDYKQHFLFRNLEEKGMKKGFDGLYMTGSEFWLYESKSTLPTTAGAIHNNNISEAYNGLRHKVEGTENRELPNNPWRNAYNHANSRAINYNQSLSQELKRFSNEFVLEEYHNVSQFNLIPSSTIYLDTNWCQIDNELLKAQLGSLVSRYSYRKLHVICLNKKNINDFIDFVNG